MMLTETHYRAQGTKNHKHKEKADEIENPFYTLEWIHQEW